jgi:hypothetical protein
MAPELALRSLHSLAEDSIVLDPMSGSGTVVRQAAQMGHQTIGVDMDPLAILMSRVWTTPIEDSIIENVSKLIIDEANALTGQEVILPWIDDDPETCEFIDFWFGKVQQIELRKLAFVLNNFENRKFSKIKHAAADVVRVALSRIIVTKEQGASLARDTSHSRPHKVATTSDFDVMNGLQRSLAQIRNRLIESPPVGNTRIILGDARSLKQIGSQSVDAVLTSPPYLNAIDYLRGHRMSLVWLGHRLADLRSIRSNSIGAERAPNKPLAKKKYEQIQRAMCDTTGMLNRHIAMIDRYSEDLYKMVSQISRVTRIGGFATFVVGNSCLKGTFIQNSAGVAAAAAMQGLREIEIFERDLPSQSRYLPMTSEGALGKRMRTETILTFGKI